MPYNVWLKAEQLSDTGFLPVWPVDSRLSYGPVRVIYGPAGISSPFGFNDNRTGPLAGLLMGSLQGFKIRTGPAWVVSIF